MVGAGAETSSGFGPLLTGITASVPDRASVLYSKKNRASETWEGQMAWGIKVLMIMTRGVCIRPPSEAAVPGNLVENSFDI